jgi:hypothetical protein
MDILLDTGTHKVIIIMGRDIIEDMAILIKEPGIIQKNKSLRQRKKQKWKEKCRRIPKQFLETL